MIHIIITGASGFIGKNLSNYLEHKNFNTQSLSLRTEDWQNSLNTQAKAIIHLAGKAHDTTTTAVANDYFKINTDLTISLFQEFLKSNIKDFFYFSSVKAVADTTDEILTEEFTANPLTPYGQSKWKAEQYLTAQKLPEGKRLFIIRPCMVHGSGNKGNLNLLYKIVEKGIPWPLTNFENQRSFLSIDNLSFLIEKMLTKLEVKSGVYHFADDEALSTNQLISLMNEAAGKKPRFLKWSKKGMLKIAKLGDILHLPLNSEKLKKLTENYVVSNQKIKSALGIEKLPLAASEGILQTINSFKK